jgi:hypothetical protein
VIDAYISDVEHQEEKFLAASDQKAHGVVEAPRSATGPHQRSTIPPPT